MTINHHHPRPVIGAQRFVLSVIQTANVKALARKRGWDEKTELEYIRDYCEPEDAATETVFQDIEAATIAARAALALGDSFYGSALIDLQEYQAAHDDRGNPVKGCPPSWETVKRYEVAMDGERIEVDS